MVPSDSASTSDLVGLFRQSLAGRIVDCNDACAQMLGYPSREDLLVAGFEYANASDFAAIIAALPDVGLLANVELALRRKGGGIAWVLQNLRVAGEEIEGAMFDVTEQRLGVQKLEYQAQHDSLTHLPNRMLIVDRMNVALARTKRHGGSVAVLIIDLDHFEVLNSAFGHGLAARAPTAIGDLLVNCLRTEDALARFGSDEFIIALADAITETDVAVVAQRVLDAVAAPLSIAGNDVNVTASIGVAMSPADGEEPETLMQRAMSAVFGAKERGRGRYHFHQSELNSRALERTALIAGLRRALAQGELELYYQPEINVQTGRIECIEALLRWRHPDVGVIAAADFLAAAEQGQLDREITEWVLFEASRQARQWRADGMRDLRVAVNVSSTQFYDRGFCGKVRQAVLVSGLESGSFELEIAEPTLSGT